MALRVDTKSLRKGYDRVKFYVSNFSLYYLPRWGAATSFRNTCHRLSPSRIERARERASYYARLPEGAAIDRKTAVRIGDFKYPFGQKKKFSTYFFDLFKVLRAFPLHLQFNYLFGDVDHETECPAFVKSRPVTSETTRSVLMPLNTVRHFRFINDKISFRSKKDMLVFRNIVWGQPHRLRFLDMYAGHPLVDAAQTNTNWGNPDKYYKPFMPIGEQLGYKFVACIQGNDVATNLKWVMSSNSIAVMPRPTVESWFMEATLIPDYHYIEIKDDFSDLPEKLKYYIENPEKAEEIIRHAHDYVKGFKDKDFEKLVARLTAERYFKLTNQITT